MDVLKRAQNSASASRRNSRGGLLIGFVSSIETGRPALQNKTTGVAIETAQNRPYAANNLIPATSSVLRVNFSRVMRRERCHRGACKLMASLRTGYAKRNPVKTARYTNKTPDARIVH